VKTPYELVLEIVVEYQQAQSDERFGSHQKRCEGLLEEYVQKRIAKATVRASEDDSERHYAEYA
jgi:hypothetical protein